MAQRQVYIGGIGDVTLAKRQGTRSLRLSINASGRVRVGLPYWVPYRTAIAFAKNRIGWINEQQVLNQNSTLRSGMKIGKAHTLYFMIDKEATMVKARIDKIGIYITSSFPEDDERVQSKARMASQRALRSEAEIILTQRVKSLGALHDYSYSEVRIKKMASRWGSCSSHKVISLNYYLMQLPWELIDYVILHELVHTKILNHGHDFWLALEALVPDAKSKQKIIRQHKPKVQPI